MEVLGFVWIGLIVWFLYIRFRLQRLGYSKFTKALVGIVTVASSIVLWLPRILDKGWLQVNIPFIAGLLVCIVPVDDYQKK